MAHVHRGTQDNPHLMVRHDDKAALTLGIAGVASDNIVDVGKRTDARLAQL